MLLSRRNPARPGFVVRLVVIVLAALVVTGLAVVTAAEVRTWSDSTGQFTVRAKLVANDQGKLTLEKEDGAEIEIDVKKLSAADQKYVADQAKTAANPFKAVTRDPFKPKAPAGAGAGRPATANGGDEGRVIVPDWTGVNAVLVAPTESEWAITVNPPVGDQGGVAMRPIPIPAKSHFFEGAKALVVNPVCRRAVIGYNRSFPPNEGTSTRLVLCDLEKGKTLGSSNQAGVVLVPLALHDDGTQVLMRRDDQGPGNQDRLELWQLASSGVVRGMRWIPYDDLKGDKRDVKWAEFLDDKRVATISNSGKLAVWEMESARPLYSLDAQAGSVPALSPDRKSIAFSTGKDVGVLDVDAAKVVAMQTMPQVHWPVLTFSPSGKRLGCAAADRMYVWDFAKGTLEREVPYYGVVVNGQAVFTTDDHVLLGKSVLIDLKNQVKLWTYQGAELVKYLGGVCWFVPNAVQNQAGALVPSPIPQAGVKEALDKALADPNFFVLKPGTTVKVNVDGLQDATQRDKIRAALEARLKANGFKVGPSGTIDLVASTEVGKDREVSYRTFGRGFGGIKTLKVREYISRIAFLSGNLAAWESSKVNIPMFARLKQGETIEQHLKAQEKPDYAYFERVELPRLLTRPSANGLTALGKAQVTTGGVR